MFALDFFHNKQSLIPQYNSAPIFVLLTTVSNEYGKEQQRRLDEAETG